MLAIVYSIIIKVYFTVRKVESYYKVIRRIFEIIRKELPKELKESILEMTFNAINNTVGLDDLISTLIVFSAFSKLNNTSTSVASILKSANIL